MEFLKKILSEDTYATLSKELEGKDIKLANLSTGDYVSKAKYDNLDSNLKAIQVDLKQRDKDLENLKKNADLTDEQKKNFEVLQQKYDTDTKALGEKMKQNNINSQVELAIAKSNAIDDIAIKAHLQSYLDKVELNEKGELIGISEQITNLKESKAHLFEVGSAGNEPNKSTLPTNGPTSLRSALAEQLGGN
jgi:Phage minor structural protein GP20.